MLIRTIALIAGLAILTTVASTPSLAQYHLCALRAGPKGPCTCKGPNDGPGQFSVVSKSRCALDPAAAKAKEQPPPTDTATIPTPAPAPQSAAAPEPRPITTAEPTQPAVPTPAVAIPPPPALSASSPKLDEVRARGKLLCGVNTGLLGFSIRSEAGNWTGLDADFCRAVAAAVFGDASKVEFVPLEADQRFDALKSGRIDILSRNTTWTMNREVDLGLEFAGVLYFDGQGFITSEESGLVSAQQLTGTVCVATGTTTEKNMAYYFKAHDIPAEMKKFDVRGDLVKAYLKGECSAYTGDRSSLFSERAGFPEPEKHAVLPEVISKEPLGPAVLEGDRNWLEVVRWTLAALINAEEVSLTRAAAKSGQGLSDDAQRLIDGAASSGEKLKLSKSWLKDVVAAVGNYGEMYEVNVGKESPLGMDRGINALWKQGGILYAPPMW